ncbi:MAG: vitamin B12-dependent ribonucleotide reductase [Dehalococcoidia bacterium]|nr:vitamin B12-dependent ribonucleotide reductase [Dehalococcoidia bacterium]
MSEQEAKKNDADRLARDQIARAVFAAAQSMGITDRELTEQLVSQVIQRMEKSKSGARLPLPGMEGLVTHGKQRGRRPVEPTEIEGIVKEALNKMGQTETSDANIKVKAGEVKCAPSAEGAEAIKNLSPNAMKVLEKRYLKKDLNGKVIETPEQMFRRVAHCIASAELAYDPHADVRSWEEKFYSMMASLEYLPNSPTLMNAGRELGQLSACFVLPVDDSMESIFEAVKQTALIHKSGGGTGFSFSRLRPESDRVGSTGGIASGPVSFLRVFDTATDVIKQGGMRRGANMAILSIDHPDILKFISAKEKGTAFSNFNLSVAMTEEFMKAVDEGRDYDLINPHTKQAVQKLNAREVFDKIVDMAWRTGDPGIIFIDRINKDNPTPNLGMIESTNPCGEQPLLPYESCNLGSINLSKMLRQRDGKTEIDYAKLADRVRLAVRFLDNTIEANKFPTEQIEKMTKMTRKIGLGVMGFADTLICLGIPYDSEKALEVADNIMGFIDKEAKAASAELAKTRGAFPAFEGSVYDRPGQPKLRNAARTTIAPTGTLSIIAGCSSGIEPLFALSYMRTILEGEHLLEVNPYFEQVAKREGFYSDELMKELAVRGSVRGMDKVPAWVQQVFATAHDITPEGHVRMQAVFQKHTDNAVSKTVNFPHDATREDVARVYRLAYELGCKGITIYRDRSKESQVLTINHDADEKKAQAKTETLTRTPRKRPRVTAGSTERVMTGCGNLYVTVNRDEHGICEVFSTLGKTGGCASAQLEGISRLISLSLRSGIEIASIVEQLRGIRCPSIVWEGGHAVLSCADAIASVLEKEVQEIPQRPASSPAGTRVKNVAGQCPDCGNLLIYQEGCYLCRGCGYTKCS